MSIQNSQRLQPSWLCCTFTFKERKPAYISGNYKGCYRLCASLTDSIRSGIQYVMDMFLVNLRAVFTEDTS